MPSGIYKRTPEMLEQLKIASKLSTRGLGHSQKNSNSLANLKNAVKFKKGMTPWNKGKKIPWMSGEKHFAWKGGTYDKDRKIDMGRKNYRAWRMAVLERDGYKCIWCGEEDNLNADHIKSYTKYPELRYAVDNGRTLCVECHKTTDSYGNRKQIYE